MTGVVELHAVEEELSPVLVASLEYLNCEETDGIELHC